MYSRICAALMLLSLSFAWPAVPAVSARPLITSNYVGYPIEPSIRMTVPVTGECVLIAHTPDGDLAVGNWPCKIGEIRTFPMDRADSRYHVQVATWNAGQQLIVWETIDYTHRPHVLLFPMVFNG